MTLKNKGEKKSESVTSENNVEKNIYSVSTESGSVGILQSVVCFSSI